MFLLKQFFLSSRFYYVLVAIGLLAGGGFAFAALLPMAKAMLSLLLVVVLLDGLLLFVRKQPLEVKRKGPAVLSLGDEQHFQLLVTNRMKQFFSVHLIDELPQQLQERNFNRNLKLQAGSKEQADYTVRPLVRGEFNFGKVHAFIQTRIGLVERRISFDAEKVIPVYPSIIQMKKYELNAAGMNNIESGVKKLRRLGHSYEFEHIKTYVRGDDYRSINWKATSRRGELMVNQYEDEKAQQVYNVIDKSRIMRMPFNGLSLLDHAINTSLVISNVALKKYDKAGLITFSQKINSVIKADRRLNQLKIIMESLYREEESQLEANYELLYQSIRNTIRDRSLIFLYTNFESQYALQRVLPVLRRINRQHLLVVVFFENTEIRQLARQQAAGLEEIYRQVIAEKYLLEKNMLVQELKQFGISSILTSPYELSLNTLNKYLELKSRGLI